MFSQNRDALRQMYRDSWQKFQQEQALSALEQAIVAVIQWHPEYHKEIETERSVAQDYFPEQGMTNPYLHMGLHLGLREQIMTDRPAGIRDCYDILCQRLDAHEAEHQMMECLAEAMWQQQNGEVPDETAYLQKLKALCN